MRASKTGVIFAFLWSACTFADTPRALVDDLHETLLAAMKADAMKAESSFEARYALIEPSIDRVFDLQAISRISLGKSWRGMDEASRLRFVGLIRDLIISTYADRFGSFGGQRFETVEARQMRPGRWIVKTHLITSDGATVTLDYYLRNELVFNIVADGVSDLSLRRADYAAVIERDGLEGLAGDIRRSIDEYRSNGAE